MKERSENDPWFERLSEHLDGELDSRESALLTAHLEQCDACRAELVALRTLVTAASALPDWAPARDLWPAVEACLTSGSRRAPRSRVGPLVALAAAALLVAFLVDRFVGGSVAPPATERFVLLLHEPAELLASADASEIEAVVERYREWGRAWGAKGNVEGGEKLADGEGFVVRPGDGPEALDTRGGIGGFFLIRADDYEQALVIARSHPHLDLGGWIEVRRIEET